MVIKKKNKKVPELVNIKNFFFFLIESWNKIRSHFHKADRCTSVPDKQLERQ